MGVASYSNIKEMRDQLPTIQQLQERVKLLEYEIKQNTENLPINCTLNCTLNLDKVDKQILIVMKNEPEITYESIAKVLGKSRNTIALHANKLIEQQAITRIGSKRIGSWKINISNEDYEM